MRPSWDETRKQARTLDAQEIERRRLYLSDRSGGKTTTFGASNEVSADAACRSGTARSNATGRGREEERVTSSLGQADFDVTRS